MPRRLFRQERLDNIVQQLKETSYVSVAELSSMFGVSTVTIRTDLDILETSGHLLRTHGGAVPINLGESGLSFSVRLRDNVQAKERIGAAAAEFIYDGEAVVLDGGTTTWHLARSLLGHHDLTVLTTGLYIAIELLRAPGISVIMPGGTVWREAAAIVDGVNPAILDSGNLQKGFFSARGLTIDEGLTDANPREVELKRWLIDHMREVTVLIDSSKLGKVAFGSCAPLEKIDRVITDKNAPKTLVADLRARDIEVIIA